MAEAKTYTLISADSHVVEPPELFSSRLPEGLRARAPKLEQHEGGSAWIIEGMDPIKLPVTAKTGSGYRPGNVKPGAAISYSDVLPALRDPAERLKAQDSNSVDAEVLYPTPGLWDAIKLLEDNELKLACTRAYNDWISEFCAFAPDRLIGLGKIPTTSIEDAVAELRRCVTELNLRGVVLDAWPAGGAVGGRPEEEPFWELVNELNVPVSIHCGIGNLVSTESPTGIGPGMKPQMADSTMPMAAAGVFDRFPNVRLVFAHSDASWAIHWLEFSDIYYLRHGHLSAAALKDENALPSEYIRRHVFFTFHHDRPAVRNRHNLGSAHLMWASHFPYEDSNWPDDRQHAVKTTAEAPQDVQVGLMARNVAQLYRLPGYEQGFTDEAIREFEPLVHY